MPLLLIGALLIAGPHQRVKFNHHRSGTIVELSSDTIVVQDSRKTRTSIKSRDTTIVHRNGAEAEKDELRVGDRVVIDVMPNDEKGLDAVMVDARAPRKPSEKSSKSK